MNEKKLYGELLAEAVDDLVYWLNQLTVLPGFRAHWAKRKARLCREQIKEIKQTLRELEHHA